MQNFLKKYLYRARYFKKMLNFLFFEIFHGSKLDIDYDKSIIFMLACDYNNVGDYLIRRAQVKYLKSICRSRTIVTIDHNDTPKYLKDIRKRCTKNTLVVLTGGGNTGSRYIGTELFRNQIVKQLRKPGCSILGFPQTIDYEAGPNGKYCLKKAKKIISNNDKYVFFAREKRSFRHAKQFFCSNRILLAPDIVLSVNIPQHSRKRVGIGLLMRNDGEKTLKMSLITKIIDELKEHFPVEEDDMVVKDFNKSELERITDEKIHFALTKRLVITDRLHGMILCFITNTPCIAFDNCNHKISETYNNWLKDKQNFIILEKKPDYGKIMRDIDKLLSIDKIRKISLSREFEALKGELSFENKKESNNGI